MSKIDYFEELIERSLIAIEEHSKDVVRLKKYIQDGSYNGPKYYFDGYNNVDEAHNIFLTEEDLLSDEDVKEIELQIKENERSVKNLKAYIHQITKDFISKNTELEKKFENQIVWTIKHSNAPNIQFSTKDGFFYDIENILEGEFEDEIENFVDTIDFLPIHMDSMLIKEMQNQLNLFKKCDHNAFEFYSKYEIDKDSGGVKDTEAFYDWLSNYLKNSGYFDSDEELINPSYENIDKAKRELLNKSKEILNDWKMNAPEMFFETLIDYTHPLIQEKPLTVYEIRGVEEILKDSGIKNINEEIYNHLVDGCIPEGVDSFLEEYGIEKSLESNMNNVNLNKAQKPAKPKLKVNGEIKKTKQSDFKGER